MNRALFFAALVFASCSDITPLPDSGIDIPDAGRVTDCFAPSPADGPRRLVASHPVSNDGGQDDNRFEVFDVSSTGAVTVTGKQFRMGTASDYVSPIAFTPDGRVGFAPHDDGKIGVFRFEGDDVVVVHAAFDPEISAKKVTFLAESQKLLVVDFNALANGGGLYTFDVACDGSLSNRQLLLAADVPTSVVTFDGKALVAARSVGTSATMQDVHLVDLASKTVLSSATGFPDRDAISASISISRDRRLVAVPDFNAFAGGNRVGFLELNGNTLTSRGVLDVSSAIAVAFSPFADRALVVRSDSTSNFMSADWNATTLTGFTLNSFDYVHAKPQLPGIPTMITRGALEGRVFVGTLDSIRQVQFERDGRITDVSNTRASGTDLEQIIGVIGITP